MEGIYTPKDTVTSENSKSLGKGITYNVAKIGRVCSIRINSQLTESATEWTTIGTLPAEYRPKVEMLMLNLATRDHHVVIQSSGNVFASKTLASGDYIQLSATYITAS